MTLNQLFATVDLQAVNLSLRSSKLRNSEPLISELRNCTVFAKARNGLLVEAFFYNPDFEQYTW